MVGKVIKHLRRTKGYRQSVLAQMANLKQPNLSRIEAGLVTPRLETIERVALALGVKVEELISPADELVVKLERCRKCGSATAPHILDFVAHYVLPEDKNLSEFDLALVVMTRLAKAVRAGEIKDDAAAQVNAQATPVTPNV